MNTLFKEIKKGNLKAFEEFYNLTKDRIFSYLYRLCKNKQLAEDVLIEVYITVWENIESFEERSQPLTWVYGIARNIMLNTLRDYSKERRENIEDISFFISDHDSENLYFKKEQIDILSKALKTLPNKYKEVLNLAFFDDLTYEEISKILNIPINTVKTRIFYAKKKLKDILGRMGIEKKDLL